MRTQKPGYRAYILVELLLSLQNKKKNPLKCELLFPIQVGEWDIPALDRCKFKFPVVHGMADNL